MKPLILGSAPDCDVVISDDEYISSHHAQVFQIEGGLFIQDAGSLNGTFVNGVRLTSAIRLRAGDSIRIGRKTVVLPLEILQYGGAL